jgi:hypothetical protein
MTKTNIHTDLSVPQEEMFLHFKWWSNIGMQHNSGHDNMLCVSLSQKHDSYLCSSKSLFSGGKVSQFKEVSINWNTRTLYTKMAINGSMVHL